MPSGRGLSGFISNPKFDKDIFPKFNIQPAIQPPKPDSEVSIQEREALSDNDIDPGELVGEISTLEDATRTIVEAGHIPFQKSNKPLEVSQNRVDRAQTRLDETRQDATNLTRIGAVAQLIQGAADLFIMNRQNRKDLPSSVGQAHGLRFTDEARTRLEAETIAYEQELEGHFERMFRDAILEERVENQNIELANQIKREDMINTHAIELETLRNNLSEQLTPQQKYHMDAALRHITQGNLEMATWHEEQAGFEVMPNGAIRQTTAPAQPQQQQLSRADQVAIYQHEQISQQVEQLRAHIQSQGVLAEGSAEEAQLKQLEQTLAQLSENPAVAEHVTNQIYEARILVPRLRNNLISADQDSDEYNEALEEIVTLFERHGLSETEVFQWLAQAGIPPFSTSSYNPGGLNIVIDENEATWFEKLQENPSKKTQDEIRNQLIQGGMNERDAQVIIDDMLDRATEQQERPTAPDRATEQQETVQHTNLTRTAVRRINNLQRQIEQARQTLEQNPEQLGADTGRNNIEKWESELQRLAKVVAGYDRRHQDIIASEINSDLFNQYLAEESQSTATASTQ